MRGHIIKSLMEFNGVIEIDKAVQGSPAMSAAGKHLFFMPRFHKGADNPFQTASRQHLRYAGHSGLGASVDRSQGIGLYE